MSDLEWSETPDGLESSGYRIRHVDGPAPGWQLETLDDPVHEGARTPTVSVHPTLPAAKRRAERNEMERIRHARVRGHLVFGAITGLVFLILLVSDSFAAFVAAMIFLYVTLRFLAGAVELGLAEAWNWDHESEGKDRLSWSAQFVLGVTNYLRKRQLTDGTAADRPSIIVLPPD